jgi:hypothetical protein
MSFTDRNTSIHGVPSGSSWYQSCRSDTSADNSSKKIRSAAVASRSDMRTVWHRRRGL